MAALHPTQIVKTPKANTFSLLKGIINPPRSKSFAVVLEKRTELLF
jgi:hypothetical protein